MSRPRSARAASGGAAGARGAASQRGVYVQSPKADIYVALLGVALGAMVLGCILLVMVLNRYGFSTKVSHNFPATTPAIARLASTGEIEKIGTVLL